MTGVGVNISVEAVNILLLLLPGFIAGQVFYSIFQVADVPASKRTLDALIFTFVTYLIVSSMYPWEPLATVKLINGSMSFSVNEDGKLIWLVLAVTVVVPIVIGSLYHSDFLHSIFRKLNITTKTSRKNTWNDAFLSQNRHVIVTLKDDRRIRGYPTMFSTDPDEGFLYLYNPAWINDDKESESEPDYFESNCHGFLLNRENIDLIEFTLNENESLEKGKP